MRRFVLAVIVLAACGKEREPYAALPLRETLLADPRDVAAMPVNERTLLRARFVTALADSAAASDRHEEGAIDAVFAHDEERRDRDSALGVVALAPSFAEDAVRFDPAGSGSVALAEDPLATPEVAALEARALSGAAGALIADVAARAGVTTIERMRQVPAAYVVSGDRVRVNVAWLVAMAGKDAPAVSAPVVQSGLSASALTSLSECTSEIVGTCSACMNDGSCSDPPVLSDFPSGLAECDSVLSNNATAENVCVTLMVSRNSVATCIRRNDATCIQGGIGTAALGREILGRSVCRRIFDGCARDPNYVLQISCDTCTNMCANLCRVNLTAGSCSGGRCSGPSASCTSCGTRICSATPVRDDTMPWWSFAWGTAPLAYLLVIARRKRPK